MIKTVAKDHKKQKNQKKREIFTPLRVSGRKRQMIRRTILRRSGAGGFHPQLPSEAPPADECLGFFFKPYNGPLAFLRMVDFKWAMNRCVALHREYYIATPIMWGMTWYYTYKIPQMVVWSDGAPPRKVHWNDGKTGKLPEGFKPTVL
jgi:hypothetical protein